MAGKRKIETGRTGARTALQPGQIARLTVMDCDTGGTEVVLETSVLIEAPNWTPDGRFLIVNEGGRLFRIAADGSSGLQEIDTGSVRKCNNDHVLSPDGKTIYVSADGHLYAVPIEGGEPRRVSNVHDRGYLYFLHGVSPDNRTLAYVAVEAVGDNQWARINIATIPAAGGKDTLLTNIDVPNDGPEYSPDGRFIYFNSEQGADKPGHAQLFRMDANGSGIARLTFDARVNWFPHVSPDGTRIVYLSYPPDTRGHPADLDVILRVMPAGGGASRDLAAFFGGQGTINVNSWAPDSRRFAYVAYPIVD